MTKNAKPKTQNLPPVAKVQILRVKGSIWRNGTDRTWHEVTFQRGFKKRDGSYGNSRSFDLQGALALRAVLDEVIPKLRDLDAQARTSAPAPEEIDDDGAYIDDENPNCAD